MSGNAVKPKHASLIYALAIMIGLLANLSLAVKDASCIDYAIIGAVIFIACSTALYIFRRLFVPFSLCLILPVALLFNAFGLAIILQIDNALDQADLKQDLWTLVAIALVIFIIIFLKDYKVLRRYSYIFMIAGVILLILPVVPGLGQLINGAKVWISIAGFSLQPAELAKICLLIFFASYLQSNKDTLATAGKRILGLNIPRIKDMGPLIIVWAVSVIVLVLERDLGTSLLFFGLFVAMLYVATNQVGWIAIGLLMFLVSVVASFFLFTHVHARVDIWLDPFNETIFNKSIGGSGQLVQGMFGLAGGGLLGTGFGGGFPWLTPFANSDFVYAALGEVLGLIGILFILFLYLVLIEQIFKAAINIKDEFGKLLLTGIGFSIALQVFVVVGGVTRVIPMTGLTLPFIARGGTSLVANWVMLALVLVVSHYNNRVSYIKSNFTR